MIWPHLIQNENVTTKKKVNYYLSPTQPKNFECEKEQKKSKPDFIFKESEPNFFSFFQLIWSDRRNQPYN